MARIALEVQASNSGIEANLRGQMSYVRRAVQGLNRRRGPSHYRRVFNATPKRTWFMANHIRFEPTPNDFGYRIGWAAQDFIDAKKYPYYRVVLFGSRTQAGNDFFSPIAEDERAEYRRELRALMQGGPMSARARRGR